MVHRDLKPGNIVLDGDVPRIADFGTVRLLNEESQTTTASQHTPLYRCPESANSNEYSRAGDVYQIGLIAYQLLGGRLDYDLLTYLSPSERKKHDSMDSPIDRSLYVQEVILERAKRERLVDLSSLPPWITLSARRLLRQMTNPDPNERPASTSDIAAEISRLIQRIPDWKFDGDIAKLISQNREFELRPTGTGDYEAYQQIRHGAFRHVPGMKPSALSELVKRFSP
jgi:serine/threonine protein kinase